MNLFVIDIGDAFKFQGGASASTSFTNLGSLISLWLPNVYVVAGLILFFLTLFGGFQFITAAGDEKKIEEGKNVLSSAILGFAILFGSYWIIQIIQILTGVPILKAGF